VFSGELIGSVEGEEELGRIRMPLAIVCHA